MKKLKLSFKYSIMYFLFFICIYLIHIKYFNVNVILYSAVFDGLFSTLFALLILILFEKSNILNNFEKMQLGIIWLFLSFLIAISFPTIIDRSLSFYILEKIQQRGGGIQLEKFEDIFTNEYVKEHRLLDVRLTEQKESGTIKIENGCVKLTEFGKIIVLFSEYFRSNLLPKQRLLNDQYTDDLIYLYRDSANITYYNCM
jgi:hypothetical protein